MISRESRTAARILGAGTLLGASAIACGLLWTALRGCGAGLEAQTALAQGRTLVLAGIAALVAAPYLRVTALALSFAREKRWSLCLACLSALGLMLVGILLGLRQR
ncbi:MAG: DUF1634 domain-containing protein [Elusimicrobiota bacterium]|jgi:hypothetical protein